MQTPEFLDAAILSKYDTSGPRYTSYPTALEFHDNFCNDDVEKAVLLSPNEDVSLYVHIPFCHSLCFYCGCNKIVTRSQDKADEYLSHLEQEITQRAALLSNHKVKHIHLGGGTPSFLTKEQLSRLFDHIKAQFECVNNTNISIEIDPRRIKLDYINALAELGVTRLSIGVQDTNEKVQQAINREQSTDFIQQLINRARQTGIDSINIDLIYGLPHQTLDSFRSTLQDTQKLDADRISLFSYAHLPERFAAQRKLKDQWLPTGINKFALMKLATTYFIDQGYEIIGMDHFAKPQNELALAQKNGVLHRDFQGYTTEKSSDLIGLGMSSISSIGNIYSQNAKSLSEYYSTIKARGTAVCRGYRLNEDDLIRRHLIRELMCNMYLDKKQVEATFGICFQTYFQESLLLLTEFERDGLVYDNINRIKIMPKARLLVRNICMAFDKYHVKYAKQNRFSRVI